MFWVCSEGASEGFGGGGTKMNSNLLMNQVTGPLLRKVKLKVAPLELPFVTY